MSTTASDVLVGRLHEWGVEVVFGLPGDGINGIMEALRKRRERYKSMLAELERTGESQTAYSATAASLIPALVDQNP